MKWLKYLLVMVLFIPCFVCAGAGKVSVNKTSITLEVGSSTTFTVSASNAQGKVSVTSKNKDIASIQSISPLDSTVDRVSANTATMWIEGNTKTITIKALSVGSTIVSVTCPDVSSIDTQDDVNNSYTITVNVTAPKSSVNTLSSISINGKNYNVSDTINVGTIDDKSINIAATAKDSKASISGTGTKTLNYGTNSFTITVTAENGSKKNYIVKVNKPDPRNSNNNIKSLKVSSGTISFDKSKTNYNITVNNDVSKITISATAEESTSTVSGLGEKTLKEGTNTFNVVVTAENKSTKIYKVTVTRLKRQLTQEEIDAIEFFNKVNIANHKFKFNNKITSYEIIIDEDDTSLEITYETNKGINASIEGNENLKDGSVITITASDDETGASKEYTLTTKYEKMKEEVQVQENITENNTSTIQNEPKEDNTKLYIILGEALAILVLAIIPIIKKIRKKKDSI